MLESEFDNMFAAAKAVLASLAFNVLEIIPHQRLIFTQRPNILCRLESAKEELWAQVEVVHR